MRNRKNTRVFYGWVIAACCALSVCGASLLSTGMSTNMANMRAVLGLTGTQTSMILTVRSISAFVVALFAEKYFEILGVKKGMMAAMLAGTVSFLIFSVAGTNMVLYYVAAVIAGVAYSYGMMMPSSILLKNWFRKSRGTALAIASCGTGLVSIVFAPLIQSMVDRFGLNSAWYLQGGFMALVAVILGILVVEQPSSMGLEPCGGSSWVPEQKKSGSAGPPEERELTKGWLCALLFSVVLVGLSASPASAHYTLNFTTEGLPAMEVAKALSLYGVILILAKILFGRAIDRLGTYRTTIIFGVLCAGALFLLFLARFFPTIGWMYLSLSLIAVGCVVQTLGYPNWAAELDTKNYTRTLERCQMAYQLGTLIGSPLPGMLADATGSYTWAYLGFSIVTVIYLLIVIGAFRYGSRKA